MGEPATRTASDHAYEIVRQYTDVLKRHFGDRLVSVVLYGSVARGEHIPSSDIDLLIVAQGLPDSRRERNRLLVEIEEELYPMLASLYRSGGYVELSTKIRTPEEAERFTPLYLDLTEDAVLLYDQDGFFLEVPRVHDVGFALRETADRFPEWFQGHIDRMARISRGLLLRLVLVVALLLSLAVMPRTDAVRAGSVSKVSTEDSVSNVPFSVPGSTLTPALYLSKSVYPHENVDCNGVVTYTIALVNDGTAEAADVWITDTLPAATTFAHWAEQPAGATLDESQVTWSGAVSASQAITITFAVTHTGGYGEVVTNTVVGQHADKVAAAHATFAVRPALTIAKTVDPQRDVKPGGSVTYTVALANPNPDALDDVVLTDTLPVSATFATWLEQPPGAALDADQITWKGTVTAGERITLSWMATHVGDRGDVVRNVATYRYLTATGSAEATFTAAQVYTAHLPLIVKDPLILPGFAYGIQAHGEHRLPDIADSAQDLGMTWVKQQVRWAQIEGTQGDYGWAGLDHIVDTYNAAGFEVLLSVTAAPDWARPGKPRDGPPNDYQLYYDFMGLMAARFKGRVRAYEIWNEPNLQREWNEGLISAWNYKRLLAGAYQAIKAADPEAIVVSAGLNPVGYTDNVTAVDDREYLQRLYRAGFKDYCDAVGAHPYGFANPPDVYYAGGDYDPNRGFDDHPSFFFRNTMEDYYAIMAANGDGHKRIWATEFGWPTVDGMFVKPNDGLEYQADITEGQQAEYIVRAFEWSHDWGHAGVMCLWNLNYWAAAGPESEMAKYSILRADWSPRQSYVALRDMPK